METLFIDTLDEYIQMNISNFLDSSSLLSFTELYPDIKTACKYIGSVHEITSDKINGIYFDIIVYESDYTLMERSIRTVKRYFGTSCNIKIRIKSILKIEMEIIDLPKFISMLSIFYQLNRFLIRQSCFCIKIVIKENISEITSKHILLDFGSSLTIPLINIDIKKQKADLDMTCFFQSIKAPYVFSQGIVQVA